MSKRIVSIIKSVISVFAAIVATVCFGLAAIGCDREYTAIEMAEIARKRFGCQKILWMAYAHSSGRNNFSNSIDLAKWGRYVVGVDKNGNEVYCVVPDMERKNYKAVSFDWPFDYSFAEIAAVYAEYGYRFAEGIDGVEQEYCHEYKAVISVNDTEDHVKNILKHFGAADELYDELDVKIVFEFYNKTGEGKTFGYFLVQRDGKLVMYEMPSGDYKNYTVKEYDKDYILE